MNAPVKMIPTTVIDLLKIDHFKAKECFDYFAALGDLDFKIKEKVMKQMALDLMTHLVAEENVLYPLIAKHLPHGSALVSESIVEHDRARHLIQKLGSMSPFDPLYDSTVKTLAELMRYHIEEEENYIFPLLEHVDLDFEELAIELQKVKKMVV
ncbi:hemerythrin domain-containing protein [Aquirhabdus sp.]|uniref:hemerythrin domain-containing protein n=1 Tax=Aquirhabdus sp. TaxID=2824160 RepID=UPI00396C3635